MITVLSWRPVIFTKTFIVLWSWARKTIPTALTMLCFEPCWTISLSHCDWFTHQSTPAVITLPKAFLDTSFQAMAFLSGRPPTSVITAANLRCKPLYKVRNRYTSTSYPEHRAIKLNIENRVEKKEGAKEGEKKNTFLESAAIQGWNYFWWKCQHSITWPAL